MGRGEGDDDRVGAELSRDPSGLWLLGGLENEGLGCEGDGRVRRWEGVRDRVQGPTDGGRGGGIILKSA